MMNKAARGSLTLAAMIASVLGSAQVRADEDQSAAPAGGLEEVIVTAQRKEESLQDVPLSVSAIGTDALVTRGINNLSDLRPGMVPGVIVTQFSGGQSVLAINIRGVAMSDPTQGTVEMTVPVYIDGVFLGRGQGLGLDLIDPERVEILRGPQGQLFGRNAEGGVVQYVSRKPSGEFGARASVSLGNYNEQYYKLAIDTPEVAGISAQVSAIKRKHDPYQEMSDKSLYPNGQRAPGPHYGHVMLDESGFRAALRYQNHSNFTADYAYDYTDQQNSEGMVTWVPVDIIGRTPSSSMPAYDGNLPNRTTDQYYNQGFRIPAQGHALTLDYEVNDNIHLKSITSYRKTARHGSNNLGPALPAGISSPDFVHFNYIYTLAKEDVDQDQTSQEFQFIGTWDQWDLTAGLTYFNEQVEDQRRSRLSGPGIVGPVAFIQPAGVAFCATFGFDPCQVGNNIQSAETDSYGAYAQANYRPAAFDNKLQLTLGARYTDDTKNAERTFSFVPLPNPLKAKFEASRVDPAAVVSWKFSDDVNTYLRYATGYRAGGANVRSSNFSSFDEEENEAWELGLKSLLFDKRLQINLAAFYNTIKGEQLTIQEAPTTNPSLTNTFNNPKDKKVKGLEGEIMWAALDSLRLGLNFTYMDAGDDWNEYDNPFTNLGVDEDGHPIPNFDYSRFYTIAAPEWSGSFTVDWDHTLSNGDLAFHAGYAYADDTQYTPGAQLVASFGPNYERPAGQGKQLDARLAWKNIQVGEGSWELALWGKNLTDESEIVYGFDGCAFGGGFCGFRQNPMTFGVEVRYEY